MGKNFLKKALTKSSNQLNAQERERREAREREIKKEKEFNDAIVEVVDIPMYVAAVRQYEYLGKFTRVEMYAKIREARGEDFLAKVVDQVTALGPYTENDMTMAIHTIMALKAKGW